MHFSHFQCDNNCSVIFFSELAVLEDNKNLENILSEFQMPKMQYGTLKVAGFGETKHL